MIPQKPFDTYKWRWLSVAPTESLLDPPVFLGVLRVFARHEGRPPAAPDIAEDLRIVQNETQTPVNLVRTPERNLIRNSGQYWKGTGLLTPERGIIRLTPFGHRVAEGRITQGEFAAIMVQQTVLPNRSTYSQDEIFKWEAINLEIRPLKLILEVIEAMGRQHGSTEAYITNNELIRIVIPLAGNKIPARHIVQSVYAYRNKQLDISLWPNCAPEANDARLAREFLLFLANFGLLRQATEGAQDDQHFVMEELFDVDSATSLIQGSIFDTQSAEQTVDEIRHSPLPSIIERQRTLTKVLTRRGQSQFRTKIMKAYQNQCLLTEERIPEILEAAHIIPVNHGGSDDDNNGFCLRVDIHRLFDSGNIRIKPTGDIFLSDAASASVNYSLLPKKIVIPNFVNPANIAWRENYS